MNAFVYCLLTKVVAVAGFVALVIHDYPWWGLLCFLVVSFVEGKKEEKND